MNLHQMQKIVLFVEEVAPDLEKPRILAEEDVEVLE